MAEQPDQIQTHIQRRIAKQLLKAHERGMTIGLLMRWHAKRYILSLVPVIPGLAIMVVYGQRTTVSALMLIFTWLAYQEFRSLVDQAQSWDVQEKCIDWEKVRLVAEG